MSLMIDGIWEDWEMECETGFGSEILMGSHLFMYLCI